jgi:hypothetical protein
VPEAIAKYEQPHRGGITVPVDRRLSTVCPIAPRCRRLIPRPSARRGVFNVEALAASKEIILCEALIDALTFWCAGFRNVTSSYGVEGFTDDILEAFRAHGTRRVYIAYDRDAAGDRAAEKLAARLMAERIECFRVLFPKGMDANEYASKTTPASQSLALVIRQAQWMGGSAARPTSAASTRAIAGQPWPRGRPTLAPTRTAISTRTNAPM